MRDVVVIFHFGLFLPTILAWKMKISKKWKKKKTQVYQKSWSYAALFLRYGAWQMSLISMLGYFFALLPPNSLKNQNYKKMKEALGDIIILHMCIKDDD